MQAFEYLELQVNPDEHYYIRRHVSRARPLLFSKPSDILYYPGPHLDLGKLYAAEGWEIVVQAPNRGYLFRRRQSNSLTLLDQ